MGNTLVGPEKSFRDLHDGKWLEPKNEKRSLAIKRIRGIRGKLSLPVREYAVKKP